MKKQSSHLNKIGRVGKPYGLLGDFYVHDLPRLFPEQYQYVALGDDPVRAVFTQVTAVRVVKGRSIIRLAALPDRTAVEKHKDVQLWFSCEEPQEADDLLLDIVGWEVSDPLLGIIGEVKAVENFGASDVLTISLRSGGECMLPLIEEYFATPLEPSTLKLLISRDVWGEF